MLTRRDVLVSGSTIAATPILLSLLAGYGGGVRAQAGAAGGTLRVAWWGGNDRAQRTQQAIDLFTKRYPQWKFNVEFTNYFAYWDKINTQAAGGALPDVFQMGMPQLGTYATKGLILDISRFADNALNLGDFDPGLLEQGKVDGRLYAVPLGGILQATVYDQTMIEQAGMRPPTGTETWADFAAYCKELSPRLPKGVAASDDESDNLDPFEVFVRQRNKELYTADGKLNVSLQDVVEWFEYWADLRQAGACVRGEVAAAFFQNDTPENTPLVQGKAACKMRWSNFLGEYQRLSKHQLGIVPNPNGPPGTRPGAYMRAGSLFSLSSKTGAAQGAASFVGAFVTDPDAVKALGMDRGVPGSAKAREILRPVLPPADRAQLEYFSEHAKKVSFKTVLDPRGAVEVQKALARNALSIPLSGASPAAAGDKFLKEAAKALSG